MSNEITDQALKYHSLPRPGKIEISPIKPLANQQDLALAYSPGVAEPCKAIVTDPAMAADMTARSNLVAVITNGTAVLGLGNIGPLAAKPVMEGKAVLFKKFAGVDVFDLEINEHDPDKLVDIIASLEPTFGGINLEDIRSPECFIVERKLKERLNIPVFHDDQHGTAIIVAAAVLNGLEVVGKKIGKVRLVSTGLGAAGIACLKLLVQLGLKKSNIIGVDHVGVIYEGRTEDLTEEKKEFINKTDARTLAEAIKDADIFLGLSAPGILKPEMVRSMAEQPIILALANPIPEILPEEVRAVRDDAIIATGRSDYPNQVNNVLCFPYIFRGALDARATAINDEMKIACVRAVADLTRESSSYAIVSGNEDGKLVFGKDYIIPKPFDPRLISRLAPAIAQAAMDSGVADNPIEDMDAYRSELSQYIYESITLMRPSFERAKADPKRLIYVEGEHPIILNAVQSVLDEGLCKPILIGRHHIIEAEIKAHRLRMRPDIDVTIVEPKVTTDDNANMANTILAANMVKQQQADAILCGIRGFYHQHLNHTMEILGLDDDVKSPVAVNIVMVNKSIYFVCDTAVHIDPTADQLSDNVKMVIKLAKQFDLEPKVALLSYNNHNDMSSSGTSTAKMRAAMQLIRADNPNLEVEGPIRADAALMAGLRNRVLPSSVLKSNANILMMPNLDSARIVCDFIKALHQGITIGPLLLGMRHPVHIMTPSTTVRRIMNATALLAIDVQNHQASSQAQ